MAPLSKSKPCEFGATKKRGGYKYTWYKQFDDLMKGDFTTYGDTRMMYCNQFITTQQKRCGHVALLFFQLWFNGILRLHGAKTPRSWVLKGMADTAGRLKNHPLLSCWLPSIWFCKCTMGLWVISDSDNPKIVTKSPALSGFLPGVCRGPQSFWEKNGPGIFGSLVADDFPVCGDFSELPSFFAGFQSLFPLTQ